MNAFRPGTVDTATQAWFRNQDPARLDHTLHERLTTYLSQGKPITPGTASALLTHLLTDDATGQLWT